MGFLCQFWIDCLLSLFNGIWINIPSQPNTKHCPPPARRSGSRGAGGTSPACPCCACPGTTRSGEASGPTAGSSVVEVSNRRHSKNTTQKLAHNVPKGHIIQKTNCHFSLLSEIEVCFNHSRDGGWKHRNLWGERLMKFLWPYDKTDGVNPWDGFEMILTLFW